MRHLFLCLLVCIAVGAAAEPNRILPGRKLATPPKIDGVLDAQEWAGAAKSGDFVHLSTGQKVAFDATIYAGYDAENVYFAIDCPDPSPSLIRATEYRRNASVEGDDHVILLINPFGSHQENDFNQFEIGAGGGMRARFAGGRVAKREWEGAWDAKARITERGWECELVVPWRTLRLPGSGVRDIEINFGRFIPRVQVPLAWCDLGAQEQFQRNGWWKDVEVPAIRKGTEILALPYQIAGYDDELGREVINTGLDLRYEITPQISSLATFNPDFRNVEGAVLNLSFSRFERLAEERRPFFVEGQQEFRLGGRSASLFAPQRIRNIDFGAKAFGKLSDHQSFGALVTTHFDHESAAVARYRRTWGEKSYLTAGLVHAANQIQNWDNTAASMELNEWRGRWGAGFIYSATDDSDRGTGRRLDLDLLWQDSTTFVAVGYQRITKDFLPRIGFAPRTGFEGMSAIAFHNRQFSTGPLTELGWEASYVDSTVDDGDETYLRSLDLSYNGTTRSAIDFGLFVSSSEFLGDKADLYGFELGYPDNDPYRNFGIELVGGRVDGEDYALLGLSANYRFTNRVTLSPRTQREKLGSEVSTLHILGVSYEIDKNRSLGGRMVVRDGESNWYLAYRHSGNLGTEWFVILGDPNADTFQRKLIVKAVVPFTLRL